MDVMSFPTEFIVVMMLLLPPLHLVVLAINFYYLLLDRHKHCGDEMCDDE